MQLIQRRSVTSHYHGSKIIFLESDGHFHCRAMKEKWKSKVLFLSAIMHRKVINVIFFLRYLHGNVTKWRLLLLIQSFVKPRKNEKDPGRGSQMTPSCKRPMDKSCDKKNWTQRPLATPGQHRSMYCNYWLRQEPVYRTPALYLKKMTAFAYPTTQK